MNSHIDPSTVRNMPIQHFFSVYKQVNQPFATLYRLFVVHSRYLCQMADEEHSNLHTRLHMRRQIAYSLKSVNGYTVDSFE